MPEESPITRAQQSLAAGDARSAFLHLRPVLDFPGPGKEPEQWAAAVALFADIGNVIAGPEFASKVRAATDGRNPQALYDLGYTLIDQDLPEAAATFLARANELAPGQEPIVLELATAFERCGRHEEACRVLRATPALVDQNFLAAYLCAFNTIAMGDLKAARSQSLHPGSNETEKHLSDAIAAMLTRADALLAEGAGELDHRDLRGWHFVMSGSLLLHLSPYGFDEGMLGRYAFVQDSIETCLEGIQKVAAIAQVLTMPFDRVFAGRDRESEILAHATAHLLGLPSPIPWPEAGTDQPGLVVVYDLASLPQESLESLSYHERGRFLWTHAACWTNPTPWVGDAVTFLYQVNSSPWGARLQVDPATNAPTNVPADARPASQLGELTANAELAMDRVTDLPRLAALARAAERAGIAGSKQRRPRHHASFAVKSSRFL
ncbi:hypothetical protein LVJ94_28250 [Pendulispora rubella]|uniref:Tetratricopeptide repeat protein n=1 Tax=Pendulispora rubella TaxID=2741070 RepID=A0ABZ2KQ61_9BACT